MNRIYWLATIIFVIAFFYVFLHLPSATVNSRLKLFVSSNLSPMTGLRVENPTREAYSSEKYFYRVVLSKSPYAYSPGFIIKEFARDLNPNGIFENKFTWKNNFLQNEQNRLYLHFNLYRRNGDKDPTLISSGRTIFSVSAR